MRILIKRMNRLAVCCLQYTKYKLLYGKRLSICFLNSIQGKLKIILEDKANCRIGKFLMTNGPLYLKCGENANLSIGDRCFFNHNCSVTCLDHIQIGDGCIFANNLVIVDHDHRRGKSGVMEGFVKSPVVIGDRVWCGANVTILKGVTIGEGAVVAAGAVVTKSIPPFELWGGVPARCIRKCSHQSGYEMKGTSILH